MDAIDRIGFTIHPIRCDRLHFITPEDVRVVLRRLPAEVIQRVRHVHFNNRRGRLGYTTVRGRREIGLCAVPVRTSFNRYLRRSQSPGLFGAVRGAQWPVLAVRRFMLYNVLLHEIGHLQIIDRKSRNWRHRFAGEPRAQDFAEYWCKRLWSEPFDHPDPVHNRPSPDEFAAVQENWQPAHAAYKQGLKRVRRNEHQRARPWLMEAIQRWPTHPLAIEELATQHHGRYLNGGLAVLLERALEADPTRIDALWTLAVRTARFDLPAATRLADTFARHSRCVRPLVEAWIADIEEESGQPAASEARIQRCLRISRRWQWSRSRVASGNQTRLRALVLYQCARVMFNTRLNEPDQWDRPMQLINESIALHEETAHAHVLRGRAFSRLGQPDRTIVDLRRARDLAPTDRRIAADLKRLFVGETI